MTPTAQLPEELLAEHRRALAAMRTEYALEQLYRGSGAKDPSLLPKLIDIGEGDVNIGEDGIPDVSAVKEKLKALRRDKAYLFEDAPAAPQQTVSDGIPTAAVRLGTVTRQDLADMDDSTYYRTVLASKHGRRR